MVTTHHNLDDTERTMTTTPKTKRAKREETVKIRMTEAEKNRLKETARREHTTLARLIRQAVLAEAEKLAQNDRPRTVHQIVVHAADPALVREIARIGNNINQIARTLNTLNKQDALTRSAVLESLTTLKTISDHLKDLVTRHAE